MQLLTESRCLRDSSADFLVEWNCLSRLFLSPSADSISPTATLRERTMSIWFAALPSVPGAAD